MALITIADIKEHVDISDNINSARKVDPQIKLAEELDLKPFLCDRLYTDFITELPNEPTGSDDEAGIYTKLLNGEEYTFEGFNYTYEGLKPALCWYAYARMLANNTVQATATGVVFKQHRDSEPVGEKTLQRLIGNAESIAYSYMLKAKVYLDRYPDIYPLWRNSIHCGCENEQFRKSGATITPI